MSKTIKSIYAIEYAAEGVPLAIATVSILEYNHFGDDSCRYTIRRKDLDKQEGAQVLQHILVVPTYGAYSYISNLYKKG